jgi:hypothetical protein
MLSAFALLSSGCGDKSATPSPSAVPSALAPVPEPERLGATLVVRDVGATWEHVRAAFGGDKSLLPSRFGTAITSWVGLPVAAAELVSDHEPALGAALAPTLLHPFEGALAFHLRSADGVLSMATQGSLATFRAERESDTKGDLLTRIGSGPDVALGIFGNHLIVGTSREAVATLGPWLSRTLAARAPAEIPDGSEAFLDVRDAFLSAALPFIRLKSTLKDGPAASVLNPWIEQLLRTTEGATRITLSLRTKEAATLLEAVIDHPAGDARAMESVAALLALPSAVDIAAFDARGATDSVAPLGPVADFLDPTEKTDLDKAGEALRKARGPGSLVAFQNGPAGPEIYARANWSDPRAGREAIGDIVRIANRDATKAALGAHGIRLVAKETVLENVGDVVRFRISATPRSAAPPKGDDSALVDVFFHTKDARLDIGSGTDAAGALRALLGGPLLDADEGTAALAKLVPSTGSSALFFDVAHLVRGPRAERSRAILVETDEPGRAVLDAALDAESLGSIVRALTND